MSERKRDWTVCVVHCHRFPHHFFFELLFLCISVNENVFSIISFRLFAEVSEIASNSTVCDVYKKVLNVLYIDPPMTVALVVFPTVFAEQRALRGLLWSSEESHCSDRQSERSLLMWGLVAQSR